MTGLEALAVIAAAVVTIYGTAITARPGMSPTTKRVLAGAFAVALGLASAIITGTIEGIPLDVTAWITRALVAVAAVIVASKGFYESFKGHLKKVEEVTTPTSTEEYTPRYVA